MEKKSISFGQRLAEKPFHVEALDTLFYFEFNDKFRDKPESHPTWEIVYVDRGQCTVTADDHSFTLSQGELYFHKPFEQHMLSISKNDYPNIFIISFHCTSPKMRFFEQKKLRPTPNARQHISTIIREATLAFGSENRRLRIEGTALKSRERLWGAEQSIMLRLELLLIELVRENSPTYSEKGRFLKEEIAEDTLCCAVIEYLQQHLYEKLSIGALCSKLCFSRSHVCGHFSKVCGMPITRYFNLMKMEEAKHLIRTTSLSFFEISERLMLSNSHYFSTLFKDVVGMTPSQYKKSCK